MSRAGITVAEVRIRNYRCLRSIDVTLGRRTVLVGENNAGKTSLLRAIHAAMGAGQRSMTESDILLAPNETRPPRDRKIIVDVLIRPADPDGNVIAEFADDTPWLAHFGEGVSQDDNGADQVALRTELSWDNQKSEYTTLRRFLKEWLQDSGSIGDVGEVVGESHVRRHTEPIELFYVDANRDIAKEMRTGGSYWRRLVSDLGLSDETVAEIETQLCELNNRLIAESEVLGHLEKRLNDLYLVMAAGEYSVNIAPVQGQVRDLSRGLDALISTEGGPSFPLEEQGMGTRSLAALLSVRAFVEWRAKRSPHQPLHQFVAVEEPEAHLQPQAQRAVFEQLRDLPGQWIITTHSPYICSQAELEDCRVLFKTEGETSVRQLGAADGETGLSSDELRQVRRQVMNTRGDILFARGLVLFEGETEEQAIPAFAERHFGAHPSTLGLSLIGVGGAGNYRPFIRLAKTFGIPWRVFSDGEPEAVRDLNAALSKLGEPVCDRNERVTVLPNGWAFEEYVCSGKRRDAVIKMVITRRATNQKHQLALVKEWAAKDDDALVQELRSAKTKYGALVADALYELPIPSKVTSLFAGVQEDLRLGGVGL